MFTRRGQVAIEFIVLVGFMLVAFTIFFLALQENLSDKFSERQDKKVKEIAVTVKNEIDLAFHSSDGYRREFSLAPDVYGKDYNISVNESVVYVVTVDGKHAISFAVKEVTGNIQKPENVITKENGGVRLNV